MTQRVNITSEGITVKVIRNEHGTIGIFIGEGCLIRYYCDYKDIKLTQDEECNFNLLAGELSVRMDRTCMNRLRNFFNKEIVRVP